MRGWQFERVYSRPTCSCFDHHGWPPRRTRLDYLTVNWTHDKIHCRSILQMGKTYARFWIEVVVENVGESVVDASGIVCRVGPKDE